MFSTKVCLSSAQGPAAGAGHAVIFSGSSRTFVCARSSAGRICAEDCEKSGCNPPISVTKLNQFPKATKRVFSAFARRRTGHTGITQQFGVRCFRPGPRPRPEAAYLGRRGAAAVESGGLVMAANREESLEKISTRGGVRPAEVVSGDMMALRPVGATIGPAVLARRASPRFGGRAPHGLATRVRRASGRRALQG